MCRARGPLWGGPSLGCPGAFSRRATHQPSHRSEEAKSLSSLQFFSSNHRLACAVSRLSALEPSRRRPLEGPPRGQGRRVTGRPSPPRSKNRAALPDQQPASPAFPSPTSSSSGSMYDPNDVPDNISGARDDAPMEMKPLPANVPHGDQEEGSPALHMSSSCGHLRLGGSFAGEAGWQNTARMCFGQNGFFLF